MWLKFCRNDFLRISDRLNRCIESTSACIESHYMETTVNSCIYSTPGMVKHCVTFKACHGNCMHRRTCVVSKCIATWKTVPFHDMKLMRNTFYHINCGVIQGFPALRKAVTTQVKKYRLFFRRVDIANRLLTRHSPLALSHFVLKNICRSGLGICSK